jgi:predicted PurR-regulated permease PerM
MLGLKIPPGPFRCCAVVTAIFGDATDGKGQSHARAYRRQGFLILIVVVSLAFGWILTSFYGAILWGVVIAIMFAPLYRRLLRKIPQRPTLAALAMIVLVVMIVILPLTLIAASLTQQAAAVFAKVQSGQLDFVKLFQQILDALPQWVTGMLDRFGVASLGGMQEKISAGLLKGSQQIASQALNIGQSTFEFIVNAAIMLYLLFFLFRDGTALSQRIKDAIPLRAGCAMRCWRSSPW